MVGAPSWFVCSLFAMTHEVRDGRDGMTGTAHSQRHEMMFLALLLGMLLCVAAPVHPAAAQQLPTPDDPLMVAGVLLRLPTVIPAGYQPYQSGRLGHGAIPGMDVLVLSYRSGGHHLHVIQGWPVPYDDDGYERAPAEEKGATTVQGHPALWLRSGVPLPGRALDAAAAQPLSLRWRSGERTPAGEPVGYALQADALTLDELLDVAESLQPYPFAAGAGAPALPIPTAGRATPVAPDPRVPAALWGLAPTLGEAPGEQFLGRIVVEVGIGIVITPSEASGLAARAVEALESQAAFPLAGAPWPDVSMMRPDAPAEEFGGRVVVELWERTVNVAITPTRLPVEGVVAQAVASLRSVHAQDAPP